MGQIELVVFDVAGTTAQDDGLVVKAFTEAIVEQGVERDSDELDRMVKYVNDTMGQRKMDVFMHLCKGNESKAEATHENFVDQYNFLVRNGALAEFPGVSALFDDVRRREIGVAITTGFPRELLSSILEQLNWSDRIDVSVASDEVAMGRPAPDMIFRSIELFGKSSGKVIDPNHVAVVGDTESDMQSGVTAGAEFVIGVTSGAHSEPQLRSAGATHVLKSAIQILPLMAN